MRRKERKIIVSGKQRPFDRDAWKHLLLTYAYYLHDEREEQRRKQPPKSTDDTSNTDGTAT